MKTCVELDGLLAERASGDLAPEDQARLDAHLPGCERCRAELASYEDALGLMRVPESSASRGAGVPPPSPRGAGRGAPTERGREHPDLAHSTLAAWKRHRRRRTTGLALGAGLLSMAAAAAAALALAPGLFAKRAPHALESAAPVAISEPDSEPDVYESVEASALAMRQDEEITSEDVALAALDAAEQP
jgi:anti-sigma factor RsiW